MENFRSTCVQKLSQLRPNATFLTIHNYTNNFGELSDFSICFHVSYENAVRRAQSLLREFSPGMRDTVGRPYTIIDLRRAQDELIQSYEWTLEGYNPLATSAHSYDPVYLADGSTVPGIKLHRDQDILHLWGFCLHKRIIFPGKYPPDRRTNKTIAKDDLRSMTPLGRFVQFKLTPPKFRSLVVQGITVDETEVIRSSHLKLERKTWGNQHI